mmetsp:Transcript_20716/g.23786  ORF Transcript_20716/g.23786 Transcript_20716/m.23786 type:complete len:227 (+) Transcript_20716:168-848(+)
MNSTPWAFMTGNTLGWVIYSFLVEDIFILVSNAPGLIISYWLNSGASKLQFSKQGTSLTQIPSRNDQNGIESVISYQEKLVLSILTFWLLGLTIIFQFLNGVFDAEEQKNAIGFMATANLIFFWGSPLSTIVTVCTNKNSSSIHIPTMITNSICSFFWCVYGLAKVDYFIFSPNLAGVFLGFLQVLLCAWYPRSALGMEYPRSTLRMDEIRMADEENDSSPQGSLL